MMARRTMAETGYFGTRDRKGLIGLDITWLRAVHRLSDQIQGLCRHERSEIYGGPQGSHGGCWGSSSPLYGSPCLPSSQNSNFQT